MLDIEKIVFKWVFGVEYSFCEGCPQGQDPELKSI